tara:strand:- start:1458 stop:1841 length:384 start_codon:yes stop_codon:yes gene_type:complete
MSGMHLLPVYYSTTNTRKRKQKKKSKSVLEAERQHAKFLKKMGVSKPKESKPKRSLAQSGSAPALGAGGQGFKSSNSDQFYNPTMAKKEENVYTGTEIIGIAQMHKSNAVPVRGKKQATEIANMRRN